MLRNGHYTGCPKTEVQGHSTYKSSVRKVMFKLINIFCLRTGGLKKFVALKILVKQFQLFLRHFYTIQKNNVVASQSYPDRVI